MHEAVKVMIGWPASLACIINEVFIFYCKHNIVASFILPVISLMGFINLFTDEPSQESQAAESAE